MPRAYTFEAFTAKARAVHGNKYTYLGFCGRDVVYTCPTHGDVTQARSAHLAGKGCAACAKEAAVLRARGRRHTVESFSAAARVVHGSTYDYSRFAWNGSHGKVEIVCPAHGSFWQDPHSHLSGVGCPECWKARRGEARTNTQNHFLERVQAVHGTKYDFSKAIYTRSGAHVTVVCPIHGPWMASPDNLYQGYGCPACGTRKSREEDFIAGFIEAHGFVVERRVKPDWMEGMELDIVVPEVRLAVEFHGTPFHASAGALYKNKDIDYHHRKWKLCTAAGYRLLQIYDFKWAARRVRYLYAILHALQLSERVYARRCELRRVDTAYARVFHDVHHHEGFKFTPPNAESYALMLGANPVGMITFSGDKVHRVSIRSGVSVTGGISKLLSIRPEASMDVMLDLGGVAASGALKSIPYWWVNPKTMEALDRRSCQRHKLERRFHIQVLPEDTEASYMVERGFMRVHGAGVMAKQGAKK